MPGTLQGSSTLALHVIPWSKLDVRERGMGKCWLSAQPSPAERREQKGAVGLVLHACMDCWTSAALPDMRIVAGHVQHRRGLAPSSGFA